tara:strand:- start:1863 stop:2369 length:507 start_codon:yes stop_codon:yes gene_type:complete
VFYKKKAQVIRMTSKGAEKVLCPVCMQSSIYTDGKTACSLQCALTLARTCHNSFDLPLEAALSIVEREARDMGLPSVPRGSDTSKVRYVYVEETHASAYWKIDRHLLDSGIDVEYLWITPQYEKRARVYRFTSEHLSQLPPLMHDYVVLSTQKLDIPSAEKWYFLPSP